MHTITLQGDVTAKVFPFEYFVLYAVVIQVYILGVNKINVWINICYYQFSDQLFVSYNFVHFFGEYKYHKLYCSSHFAVYFKVLQ